MLKEKQKELEDQANLLNKQNEATEKESKDALLFKTDLPPLHRKQSTATKPRKQQAVVTPLQSKMWFISSLQSSWDTVCTRTQYLSGLVFHDPLKIFLLSLLCLLSCVVSMLCFCGAAVAVLFRAQSVSALFPLSSCLLSASAIPD